VVVGSTCAQSANQKLSVKVSVGHMLRDQGLQRVASNHENWLAKARAYAWVIARAKGVVSINDLRSRFTLPAGAHHNLWGAVFHCADFRPTGLTQAAHAAAHARTVREYTLTEVGNCLTSSLE
jgi:hypothetical protein